MPKKKKTRKQKELTDVRHQTEPTITYTAMFEPKSQERQNIVVTKQPAPSRNIMTADYRYLAGDLRKTLLLTFIIITIQLGLKFGANL
jgi:hypothetical protein